MLSANQLQRRIIVIDDDSAIWQAYKSVLNYHKETQDSASNKIAALLCADETPKSQSSPIFNLQFSSQGQDGFAMVEQALADEDPFSVAFIDIRMPPGWDGMETAAKIRQVDPDVEIVIVTAYTDRSREEIVRKVGAPEKLLFLRKPFDPEELYQMALSLSEKWQLVKNQEAAQAALVNSEKRFRALVETTSDFVWEVDAQGRFTYCSPVSEKMYGFMSGELLGTVFFDLMTEKDASYHRQLFEQCLDAGTVFHASERCCIKKDGEEVQIETNCSSVVDEQGVLTGFRGIDRDITERLRIQEEKRRLEEQYHHSQKMEAIGTLAGGIAHDINNVLTPIIGYAEISLLDVEPKSSIARNLGIIESCAKKAGGLIRQILTFSRKQVLSPEVFDLNELIEDFMKMLRRMIREDIELEVEMESQLWPVNIDTGQVEQILMNLVVNARDAVDQHGRILIQTKNMTILQGQEIVDIEQTPFAGNYVVLEVSDNGSGMDQETIGRIFDPFFTTKEVGQGTGLGLATVFGVTKQHDGHIVIDSTMGQGSSFSIYLPRTEEEKKDLVDDSQSSNTGGTENILLVEDDFTVRVLASSLLENLGYTVMSATNGLQAIEMYKEAPAVIDMVVTDVIMPGQGGRDLVENLRNERPGLPVLFLSGYPRDMTPNELIASPNTDFLQKPFNFQDFGGKVRRLLDGE